jgi:hypothetical protein
MKDTPRPGRPSMSPSQTKEIKSLLYICIVGTLIGAWVGPRIVEYFFESGPDIGPSGFGTGTLAVVIGRLCGGLLGPLLTFLVSPQLRHPLARSIIAISVSLAWVILVIVFGVGLPHIH